MAKYRLEIIDEDDRMVKVIGHHYAETQADVSAMLEMYADEVDSMGDVCDIRAISVTAEEENSK